MAAVLAFRFLTLLCALSLLASSALGAELYVPDDHATVQAAVAAFRFDGSAGESVQLRVEADPPAAGEDRAYRGDYCLTLDASPATAETFEAIAR